ncbi:MAG TPA: hypothetical protein VKU19_40940 [Bryobacteraceae bacterium]|nr:hypothetical protein [Bryobacteraceae bacterium]
MMLALAVAAMGQGGVTVDQLVSFIKTSIQSKQDDKKIAEQVQKIRLSNRLDAKTVQDLQRDGAGPKTVAALQKLSEASATLPAAAPPPPPSTPSEIPPPSPAELRAILNEIQHKALDYTESLPNYICSQYTKRFVDPTGTESWRLADTILEQLSYVDHQEHYIVKMHNDTPVTNNMTHDQLGGAKSSGEFASILRTIFDPATQTEFTWERWTSLRTQDNVLRPAYVFNFRVTQPRYSILHEGSKRTVTVGFHGEVFADRETKAVMRVKMQCDNIPPDFPIQNVSLVLYYDLIDISGQTFVLPLQSEVRSREGKYLARNEVGYHSYHKYSADASISFGAPEDIPQEKLQEVPPKKKQ